MLIIILSNDQCPLPLRTCFFNTQTKKIYPPFSTKSDSFEFKTFWTSLQITIFNGNKEQVETLYFTSNLRINQLPWILKQNVPNVFTSGKFQMTSPWKRTLFFTKSNLQNLLFWIKLKKMKFQQLIIAIKTFLCFFRWSKTNCPCTHGRQFSKQRMIVSMCCIHVITCTCTGIMVLNSVWYSGWKTSIPLGFNLSCNPDLSLCRFCCRP